MSLKASSVPSEYYLGDKPGTIQYRKSIEELIAIEAEDEPSEFFLVEEDIRKIIPHTKKKWINHKVILMMKKEVNGVTWLKVAIEGDRGEIALLTSTNSKEHLNRPIKTLTPGWFMGHYRMSAPSHFWIELKKKLINF